MSTPQHVRTHGQASPDQSANVMQVGHRPTAIKPTSLSIESGIARPLCISSLALPDQYVSQALPDHLKLNELKESSIARLGSGSA